MFPALRKEVSADSVEELQEVRTSVELRVAMVARTLVELAVHQSSRSDSVQLLPAGDHH